MAHVAEYKKRIVKKILDLISQYPITGAVNMENLPTPQLQTMRAQLRGQVEIFMTKRRLIKIVLEKAKEKKKGIEGLEAHLKGMPALIFTKDNPFSLAKTLKKNKSNAPAKANQTAPKDIEIKAGPTSFMPGPIIGELGQLGIKCGVEGGKVAIKEDKIVVKEGEKISQKAAELLTRMGIEPMEVGLDLQAVYENGMIFEKKVLDIDEGKFLADLQDAAAKAMNLAVEIAYPTKEVVPLLIGKAFNDAKALGLSQEIIDEGIIDQLLGNAQQQMLGLKTTANIEVPEKAEKTDEKPKVKKEEPPKAEEKPTDVPKVEEKTEAQAASKVEEKKPAPAVEASKEEKSKVQETQTEQPKAEPAPKAEKEEQPKPEIKPQIPKKEEVLEEEKKIIQEEKKLEQVKPKIEAPVEEEIRKDVKEIEEKQLEKERIEKEKEFERIEKEKKAEEQDDTDKKIADMVKKTKEFTSGKTPTADKIIEEVSSDKPQKADLKKPEKQDVPSAHELAKKKKQDNHKKAESLVDELIKKGTLRK